MRQHRAAHDENAFDIDPQHCLQRLERHLERRPHPGDAGIVDEHIDLPEAGEDGLDRAAHLVLATSHPPSRRDRRSPTATACAAAPSRSSTATAIPSRASRRAISRPIPPPAPVTSPTRPCMVYMAN